MIRLPYMRFFPEHPFWAKLWSMMTVNVHFWYEDEERLRAWGEAIGATVTALKPREPGFTNQAAIFKDSRGAMIFFEGTVGTEQLWQQVYESEQVTDARFSGAIGSYWRWYFARMEPWVLANLPSSSTAPYTLTISGHSLGGAIAQLFTDYFKRNFPNWSINACVAFGSPRVGNETFVNNIKDLVVRIVNEGDPVTMVPPTSEESSIVGVPYSLYAGRYQHAPIAFALGRDGECTRIDDRWRNALVLPSTIREIRQGAWIENLYLDHLNPEYLYRLGRQWENIDDTPDVHAAGVLVSDRNQEEAEGVSPPPTPLPTPLPTGANPRLRDVWGAPGVTVPSNGDVPAIPPAVIGRLVESKALDYQFFSFGGSNAVANVFRGHDRRLLETLAEVLRDIKTRDLVARTQPKSHKVSTRQLMFPAEGENADVANLENVLARATELLSQTT